MPCFDKAIELNPKDARIWNNKGTSLMLGRYLEALQCYDKAIELDPNIATAWAGKGLSLKSLGRDVESQEYFNKARELGYKG